MKRLREIVLGVPGLIAWQMLEHRPVRSVETPA